MMGELSVILGELLAVARNEAAVDEIERLRQQAETGSLAALASVAARGLKLTDAWCWDSLMRGDSAAFAREAKICAELWEFAICAGLVEDR